MPANEPVDLSDQELKLVQEVQARLGFETEEQTIEFLLSQRLRERLLAIAGRELKRTKHS
ncbi:hypothetical protein QSV37_17640 [Acinetobacter sp. VNK23]|uniref:hypothetical protein n=1 Tax=Acinetobacter thutiue TaxID=2998078 RepID=UPI002576EF33|nr:hypothetical protein [Acinetobacter thutiue]MDM1022098.1 hypothetical protein [Acinetobacter thutiue]